MLMQSETVLETKTDRPRLDTRVPRVIRILNGALDEDPETGAIVLNGRLDPSTLRFLKVGPYQRPLGDRKDIFDALKSGVTVPNIDIGVRGNTFATSGDDYEIADDAYIIDGWQRVGTALRILENEPDAPIRMFATVHFGTDEISERHRFTELNKNVKKVAPNLHLANMRDRNDAVATLYGLTFNQPNFALFKRVSWGQNMARGDLTSALTLLKTSLHLHAHKASLASATIERIAPRVLMAVQAVSLMQYRKNVMTFFEVLDDCWPVGEISYRKAAPQIKENFLIVLARFFSGHLDFWNTSGSVFFVAADMRRKLAKFPLNDPHIANLAGSHGAARAILAELLTKHMNSGRRTGHLRPRAEG
jgi:hypothetical protein